jgi:hypothetical protein
VTKAFRGEFAATSRHIAPAARMAGHSMATAQHGPQCHAHEAPHLCARAHPTRLPGMTVDEPRCSGAAAAPPAKPASPLSAARCRGSSDMALVWVACSRLPCDSGQPVVVESSAQQELNNDRAVAALTPGTPPSDHGG